MTPEQKTLRDEMAMAALTGFIASYANSRDPDPETAAKNAYKYADAMMEARKNNGK